MTSPTDDNDQNIFTDDNDQNIPLERRLIRASDRLDRAIDTLEGIINRLYTQMSSFDPVPNENEVSAPNNKSEATESGLNAAK